MKRTKFVTAVIFLMVLGSGILQNARAEAPLITEIDPNQGPASGQALIVIKGANFSSGLKVSFGGIDAGDLFVSDTTVVCSAPPHEVGTVDVTVTNPDSQSYTCENCYTYDSVPSSTTTTTTSVTSTSTTSTTVTTTSTTTTTILSIDDKRDALIAFYYGTNGDNWQNRGNWLGNAGSECTWYGITCNADNNIISMDLADNHLEGEIPASIAYLPYLERLDLSDNSLGGSIPDEIESLSELKVIKVNGNLLSGNIPNGFVSIPNLSPNESDFRWNALVPSDEDSFNNIIDVKQIGSKSWTEYQTLPPLYLRPSNVTQAKISLSWTPRGNTSDDGGYKIGFSAMSGGPYDDRIIEFDGITKGFYNDIAVESDTCHYIQVLARTDAHAGNDNTVYSVPLPSPDNELEICTSPSDTPMIIEIIPSNGPSFGSNVTVTILGAHFISTTEVYFDDVKASTTYISETKLTCIPPGHNPGTVDVKFTNPGAIPLSATCGECYVYDPPPDVVSVTPNFGYDNGGSEVTITGSNFDEKNGVTVKFGGILAQDVDVISTTRIKCTTPAYPLPGNPVDVEVINADDLSDKLVNAYTYNKWEANIVTITGVSPNYGSAEGGKEVTITGSGFELEPSVTFNGIAATGVSGTSTEINCTTPSNPPETVDVVVENQAKYGGGKATCEDCYIFAYPPSLIKIDPENGPASGGNFVRITGSGFEINTTVTFGGIPATDIMVSSAEIFCTTPAHEPSLVDVVVSNPDGQSAICTDCYTYNKDKDIVVNSVYPNIAELGQELEITLRGEGFGSSPDILVLQQDGEVFPIAPVIVNEEQTSVSFTLSPPETPGANTLIIHSDGDYKGLNNAILFTDIGTLKLQEGKKAIIVAGGGLYEGNTLWKATQTCANKAYLTLIALGYARENIYYLSPDTETDADNDGTADADDSATSGNLLYALNYWAKGLDDPDNPNDIPPEIPAEELLIYMTGHGGDGTFEINGITSDILKAGTLNDWLGSVRQNMNGKLIFVYDACMSGSFVSQITGENAVVISSTLSDKRAWFLRDGEFSFSYYFWDNLYQNGRLYQAFDFGKKAMETYQSPLINMDGDGEADELTQEILENDIIIGRGGVAASDSPEIISVCGEQTLYCENSGTLWVSEIKFLNTISTVYATIISPAEADRPPNEPGGLLSPTIKLKDITGDGSRYEGIYENFTASGEYTISIHAIDKEGYYSVPKLTGVVKRCGEFDLNGNEKIDLPDAIIALRKLTGKEDMDIGLGDVVFILKFVTELTELEN